MENIQLTEDTYLYLFTFLPVNDVIICMNVCKLFYSFYTSQPLWKKIFTTNYDISLTNGNNNEDTNDTETIQMAINLRNLYYDKFMFCRRMNKLKNIMGNNTMTIENIYKMPKICMCNTILSKIPQELGLLNNLISICLSTDETVDETQKEIIITQLHDLSRYRKDKTLIAKELQKLFNDKGYKHHSSFLHSIDYNFEIYLNGKQFNL
jgi:hypothetical protein